MPWTGINDIVQGSNIIEIFHGLPKILQANYMKMYRKFGHMYFHFFYDM